MIEKFFLVQIKRTNGTFEKGVVVKDTLDGARQSFHAYLGAYGYEHDVNTDYVACYIYDINGNLFDWKIDNRLTALEPVDE